MELIKTSGMRVGSEIIVFNAWTSRKHAFHDLAQRRSSWFSQYLWEGFRPHERVRLDEVLQNDGVSLAAGK